MISSASLNTLRLKCVKGINDAVISRIFQAEGTLINAFSLDFGSLAGLGIKKETAENIITQDIDEAVFERELEAVHRHRADIVCLDDENYPSMLKQTEGAPPLLFVRGQTDVLSKPSIAVVGSRNATRQSCDFAKKLSEDLADVGFCVVSGFALGIDVYAHAGAVNKGYTAAVMGCGLNTFYPEANRRYQEIVLNKGCIITEFFSDVPAYAGNFPQRNRIISGMALGVVVVEASARSGSLITVRYALEQGREVFAVPAFPGTKNCMTNSLIKDGARLTESYYDIVEEFRYHIDGLKEVDNTDSDKIEFGSPDASKIYAMLEDGMLTPDEISTKSGINIDTVSITLVEMELNNYLVREIDGRYRVSRR